ncbi:MAG: DUF3168 domain-containing protein [Rhodocyclaceae bacterium]|nr:DUF3168 domain-containing protein [Rhodocyclaceae bacterium]MCP5234797.1 DUF3168 domain-containing protein [Zoogloeaceae bacterium]
MTPAIFFSLIVADADALAALGSNPVRFYEIEAPEGTATPYATWQVVTGNPINVLDGPAPADHVRVQLNIVGATPDETRDTLAAIRRAVENDCYLTAWRGVSKDPETGLFLAGFDTQHIIDN